MPVSPLDREGTNGGDEPPLDGVEPVEVVKLLDDDDDKGGVNPRLEKEEEEEEVLDEEP